MNKVTCKYCKKPRVKIDSGRKANDGSTIWLDQDGRSWTRAKCPACRYGTERRERYAGGRGPVHLGKRRCRKCQKKLPASRYFYHDHCAPAEHSSEGQGFYSAEDWGYGVGLGVPESRTFKISEMNLLGAT